jgi:RNA polymerase sigma-70 factor (ECF subfamily)
MEIALNVKLLNNEQSLIEACLAHDRLAQKKLYETYYGKMMGVSMRYANTLEDAQDIMNESFVKIFRNLYKYNLGTSLDAWIKRIIVNTAIDFYRKSLKHKLDDIDAVYDLSDTRAEDALSTCRVEDLMKMISSLPVPLRTVFNMYVIEGYSHREISEALSISEGTSRANLTKARIRLKELIVNK